jgi:hypothetical protein
MAHRSRIPGRRGSSAKNFGPEDLVFNVKTNSVALQSNPPVIGNSAGADLEQRWMRVERKSTYATDSGNLEGEKNEVRRDRI